MLSFTLFIDGNVINARRNALVVLVETNWKKKNLGLILKENEVVHLEHCLIKERVDLAGEKEERFQNKKIKSIATI